MTSESLIVHRISNAIRSKWRLAMVGERNVARIENLGASLGAVQKFEIGARFLWNMKLCLNGGCDEDDGFCCLTLLENYDVC